jgi:hypothetical protein
VEQLGFGIDRSYTASRGGAGGIRITTLGTVRVWFESSNPTTMFEEVFNVIEENELAVILGHEFLEKHEWLNYEKAQPVQGRILPLLALNEDASTGKLAF